MSIEKLIREYATREKLPIQVEEVVATLVSWGVKDEIYFFDDDRLDAEILQGLIVHWEFPMPDGSVKRVADISTARSLSIEEKRLVQTKELLHIIDPSYFRVNTLPATELLIDKIVISPALQDPGTDGDHANSDRAALWHALAVLFPMTVRNLFIPVLLQEKIALEQIAQFADLPLPYIAMAMSDQWTKLHRIMAGI